VSVQGFGNDAGYQRLCQDQADVIGVTRAPSQAEADTCQTAQIQTLQLRIGSEALVVVVNSDNPFASCFSSANLERLFSNDFRPTKWSQVAQGFPELELLVIMPRDGSAETDFLLSRVLPGRIAPVPRLDGVTTNDDPLFRAAATQNVAGVVTYMTYSAYKKSTSKVKAIAIDTGNGCVAPTDQTIQDGTYPLAAPLNLVFNLRSLSRAEVRAYVWYLLSDDALTVLAQEGVVGTRPDEYVKTREIMLERFAQLEAANATPVPSPQSTLEATAQATQAATAEATQTSTPEPTSEPTAASTPAN
jgi:phosphate transport system substrate-binding protein